MELTVNETKDAKWESCMEFEGRIATDLGDDKAFLVSEGFCRSSVIDLNRILSEKSGQLVKVAIYFK